MKATSCEHRVPRVGRRVRSRSEAPRHGPRPRALASRASRSSSDEGLEGGNALQSFQVDRMNPVEAQPALEKGLDRDFVGGVQHRRGARRRARSACHARCRPGKRASSAASKVRAASDAKSSLPAPLCDALRPGQAVGDGDAHVGRAELRDHRRILELHHRVDDAAAGGSPPSTCSGVRPNSQRASITSSALFIMVAESTEILRPIDPIRVRAGLLGRDLGQRARIALPERAARGGQQHAGRPVRPRWRGPRAGTGRWPSARCRSAAAWRRPRAPCGMNSSPPTTSASLLASSSRLPARAAARQGARPAAPTMAAMTASACGCAAISSSAAAPLSTRVGRPLWRLILSASSAGVRRARHHGELRREAARTAPAVRSTWVAADEREHLEALRDGARSRPAC